MFKEFSEVHERVEKRGLGDFSVSESIGLSILLVLRTFPLCSSLLKEFCLYGWSFSRVLLSGGGKRLILVLTFLFEYNPSKSFSNLINSSTLELTVYSYSLTALKPPSVCYNHCNCSRENGVLGFSFLLS